MIYLILILALSICFVYKNLYLFRGHEIILLLIPVSIISTLFVGIVAGLIWLATPSKFEFIEDRREDIVSINNKSSIDGSFVLGSGSVNEREYYFTFVKRGAGFKREKFPVDSSLILEGGSESPRVTWKIFEESKPWWAGFWPFTAERAGEYNIHVPEGTIIRDFKLE